MRNLGEWAKDFMARLSGNSENYCSDSQEIQGDTRATSATPTPKLVPGPQPPSQYATDEFLLQYAFSSTADRKLWFGNPAAHSGKINNCNKADAIKALNSIKLASVNNTREIVCLVHLRKKGESEVEVKKLTIKECDRWIRTGDNGLLEPNVFSKAYEQTDLIQSVRQQIDILLVR